VLSSAAGDWPHATPSEPAVDGATGLRQKAQRFDGRRCFILPAWRPSRAVLDSLPASKPWQRQLRLYLADVDRLTQILRLTVSLNRASTEVSDATQKLRVALRIAQRYVSTGRADAGTKAAILLACELGLRIDSTLS
jgi:hypothetical protein